MTRSATSVAVECVKRPSGAKVRLELELKTLTWRAHGPFALSLLSPAGRDLVELARTIHEIDRLLPRRIAADRIRSISVEMSLRDPKRWNARRVCETLAELLSVQGNAEWLFTFSKRRATTPLDHVAGAKPIPTGVRQVVLFSGGLDSTSGIASMAREASESLLISYYSRNLEKQQALADRLGFGTPVQVQAQWQQSSGSRPGGQFWYRSFLYLSLAAAIAQAVNASELRQFENGPLAWSVPPMPLYRMSRHAHPYVHRLAVAMFSEVLDCDLKICNPFLGATKAEAVRHLREAVRARGEFKEVVLLTETCWNLYASKLFGRVPKRVGQPCGACIPCLVRRTALQADEVPTVADLTSRRGRHSSDPLARVHVDAYLEFARRISKRSYSPSEFLSQIPQITARLLLVPGASPSALNVLQLYQRFAEELIDTFPQA